MSNEVRINYVGQPLKATISNGDQYGDGAGYEKVSGVNYGTWILDLAQSHHYTVELEGFRDYGVTPYGQFLPVRSINFNRASFENMSIPVSIFGDFPLLNRRRVSSIAISCYDTDDNIIEKNLRSWELECFPLNRYVAYLEDVARKFVYKGYNVKGVQTFEQTLYVIPTGGISVGRDYSANEAKILNFSLMAVGDGSSCATGSGGSIAQTEFIERTKPRFQNSDFNNNLERATYVTSEIADGYNACIPPAQALDMDAVKAAQNGNKYEFIPDPNQ